jgi:acid stress-induced BolA-like protein IbaG/YrbA
MKDVNWFRKLLERSLEGLPCTRIDAIQGDPFRFLGIVVSPAFEGMEDFERQEIVWDRVLKTIDWSDLWRIEFLFTNAPSEVEAEAETNEPTAEKAGYPS